MKSKGIVSETAFPKSQKQTTFIVRPKHSQPKIMQPVLPNHLQNKLVNPSQIPQKTLEICLRALQHQILNSIMMQRSVSQKIEGLLLALRDKYIYQEQSYNQYDKDGIYQQVLRRNQSNKQLGRGKLSTEHLMNKQNGNQNASCFLANNKGKSLRGTNRGSSGNVEEEYFGGKLVQLNRQLERYQLENLALKVQIAKLESDLNSQAVEKIEKQATIDDLRHGKSQLQRILRSTMEQKETIQYELRRSKQQLALKLLIVQQKLVITQKYLKQRETQQINLWQALQAQ